MRRHWPVGAEVSEAAIDGGRMLYDAQRTSNFSPEFFEPEYWRRHDPKYTRKEDNKVLVTDLAFNNWNRDSSLDVDIWPDWVGP